MTVKLSDLRPGTLFVTINGGIRAVTSEYHYSILRVIPTAPLGQILCILLDSGEYAHFPDGNNELVQPISLDTIIQDRDDAIHTMEKARHEAMEARAAADNLNTLAYDLKQERDAATARAEAAEAQWSAAAATIVRLSVGMMGIADIGERIDNRPDIPGWLKVKMAALYRVMVVALLPDDNGEVEREGA